MIDERHEELAALHALDLLEGEERAAFERELAHNAELRALVDQLREAAAALAHAVPEAAPPAALKARVFASLDARDGAKIIRPAPSVFRSLLPWAAAAGFALLAAWLGELYQTSRIEAQLLDAQQRLSEATLQSTRNQLEAERIVARRQLADLNQQVSATAQQLADAQQRSTTTEERLATTARQLAEATQKLTDAAQQIAALNQRADAAARLASDNAARATELDQLLANARTQVTTLEQKLKSEGDLANFKIATLASMLKNSPQALAVAVWNPAKQEGVLTVEKLPTVASDHDYELWVIDPEQPKPIAAGVFAVAADGTGRARFTAESPIGAIKAFAVSREKKGGAPAHAGPQGEVIMISK